jgi:hypothetical protein
MRPRDEQQAPGRPAAVPDLIAGEWLDVKIGKRRREIGRAER